MQQLVPTYINPGKVKYVFKNFPVIGQESVDAAAAAECAGDQNKFWLYGTYLFEHQTGENVGAFTPDHLKQFAGLLGLDTNAFNSCLDSGKYASAVQQDLAQGRGRGVQATPTFFVNGTEYEGALTIDQLTQIINSAGVK